MRTSFLFLLFQLSVVYAGAQEFRISAKLLPVDKAGFYKIPVTPALSSYSREDLADLRIVEGKNRQVAYLVRGSRTIWDKASFTEFPILSVKTDSGKTEVVIQTNTAIGVKELSLLMGNTAVERYAAISGSNDRKSWYIINENIPLLNGGEDSQGSFVQTIRFPLSRYRFFRLLIDNQKTDPLHIQKTGIYTDSLKRGVPVLISNPAVTFVQKDSADKNSYVYFNLPASYPVNHITFRVSGPVYYRREAKLFSADENGKSLQYLDAFTISSDSPAEQELDGRKYQRFLLQVSNRDDLPLKVEGIITTQVQKYLVAHLDGHKDYRILAGNEKAARPQFDISYFNDRIPDSLPPARYELPMEQGLTGSREMNTGYLLWVVLVAGVLVLGLLSYKLMEDMKRARTS